VISRRSRIKVINVLKTNILAAHREKNSGGAYENSSSTFKVWQSTYYIPLNHTLIVFIN
jgi:hypothetical protein